LEREVALVGLPIRPEQFAEVVALVDAKTINSKVARQVVDFVLAGEGDPGQIVEAKGLGMVSDDSALQTEVDKALAANPDIADKIRSGKVQAAGKIVGDVMKATRGQADAARVRELVLAACGAA
jgi:aspartyl-tRNA(Asn)/glutamyl-tRNA(Gln) amidotransferase subunit B